MPDSTNIEVASASGKYNIEIAMSDTAKEFSKNNFILADKYFFNRFENYRNSFFIKAREESKSLEVCAEVLTRMSESQITRQDSITAIGGGIVQDIATFCSSIYMRGIKWSYYPTTLMAALDSCIGGKSSINVGMKKNLVGNIYPPSRVIVNLDYFSSLSIEAVIAGLCEGIKICFARDKTSFEKFVDCARGFLFPDSVQGKEGNLAKLIHESLIAKKYFVEVDEFDNGERQKLNFGHTFGHAIESGTNYSVPHGIAIGVGMLAALSHPKSFQSELENKLAEELVYYLQQINQEYIDKIASINEEIFQQAFEVDKKHQRNSYFLVLPTEQGLQKIPIEKSEISINEIFDSLRMALSRVYQ